MSKRAPLFALLALVLLSAVLLWRPPTGSLVGAAHMAASFSSAINISNSSNPGVGENASQHVRGALAADGYLHATWMEGTLNSANGPAYVRGQGSAWPLWEWAGPSNNSGYTNPTVALDSNGTVHLVWTGGGGSPYDILYASKPPGGSWSGIHNISQDESNSIYPSIAIDGQDRLWVTWETQVTEQDFEVYACSKPAGGAWEDISVISNRPGQDLEPAIVVDAADVPHVVWRNNDAGWEIYHSRYLGGSWTTPNNLSSNGSASHYAHIAANNSGDVFVVWEDEIDGADRLQILFRRWDGSQWGSTTRVSSTPAKALWPAVAAEGCNLYAVWTDFRNTSTETYFSHSTDCGSTWLGDENVSSNSSSSFYPDVVAQAGGLAHVFWQDYAPGQFDVYYSVGTVSVPTPTPSGPTHTPTWTPAPPTPTDTPTPTPPPHFDIAGQVLDLNGNPLAGVTVSAGGAYQASTDAAGLYSLTDLPAGSYLLLPSRSGYSFAPTSRSVAGPPDALHQNFSAAGPALEEQPRIQSVRACFQGPYYLSNCSLPNPFEVRVDWQGGQPGYVDFVLNDMRARETADAAGVTHSYDMCSRLAYSPQGQRNRLEVVAVNAEGLRSVTHVQVLIGVDAPAWAPGPFVAQPAGCPHSAANLRGGIEFPPTPLEAQVSPPAWFPYLGDQAFGLPPSQPWLALDLATDGLGQATLSGDCAVMAAGRQGEGQASGRGELRLSEGQGLQLSGGLLRLQAEQAFEAGAALSQTLPSLQGLAAGPLLGGSVRWIEGRVELPAWIEPALDVRARFEGDAAGWSWQSLEGGVDTQSSLALSLRAAGGLQVRFYGGGDSALSMQPPVDGSYLKETRFGFYAGAQLRAWGFCYDLADAFCWSYTTGGPQSQHGPRPSAAGWRANRSLSRVAAGRAGLDGAERIAADVYAYAEPSLALSGTQALLLWAHDDASKPPLRGEEIRYSIYDGLSWSAPLTLTDDSYQDFAPQVAYDDLGGAVAVWERMSVLQNVSATLDLTYTRELEIVYARFNGLSWTAPLTLTDNSRLDHAPLLAPSPDDQHVLLLWRQNSQGHLLGSAEAPDTLYSTLWDGSAWSVTATLKVSDSLEPSLACYSQSLAGLVYVRDLDGDPVTAADQELYASTWDGVAWSSPQRLTDDDQPDGRPTLFYDTAGSPQLLWLKGGTLYQRSGALLGPDQPVLDVGGAGLLDYRAAQDAAGRLLVLWPGRSQVGRDLHYVVYDAAAGSWGEPLPLTADRSLERMVDPVLAPDGQLWLALLQDELFSETIEVSPSLVISGVTVLGASDLYVLSHTLGPDLAVTTADLSFFPPNPAPGSQALISATVHNRGDLAVPGAAVALYEGDPLDGGTLLLSRSLDLGGGRSATFSTAWAVSAEPTSRQIYLLVDPDGRLAEWDEGNNQAHVPVVLPDLVLLDAWTHYGAGSLVTLTAAISNGGLAAADAFSVAFRLADPLTGTLLGQASAPGLAGGEALERSFVWDASAAPDGWHAVYAVANPDGAPVEADTGNNSGWAGAALLPDLVLPAEELSALLVEDGLMLIVPVRNQGARDASGAVLGLYGRWPGLGWVPPVQCTVDVPAGSKQVTTMSWSGPWHPGLYAGLNVDGALAERDLGNDIALLGRSPRRAYLPLIFRAPAPTPTPTPTASPTAVPTPTPSPSPTPQADWRTIVYEDFEGNFPGDWTLLGGSYSWGKRDCRVYAGTHSGWAVGGGIEGGDLPCGSHYPNGVVSWMLYGPFSLADASAAEMTFQHWRQIEDEPSDYACWLASVDGQYFYGYCPSGHTDWAEGRLDLADVPVLGNLLGRPQVWVGFYFVSDAQDNSPEGFYLDDILLRKYVGPLEAVP
ncbi:MAG: carboxypeptidase regulatory-like domain-containing protein [Chloroflexia bacterium]|nr:carboxypeptidase regulatory-like domain-containing protein [Chloroflexia bacterium]